MRRSANPPLLSRISYRQVVKGLEHYRKQHEDDRLANPTSIPPAWGMSLIPMIERVVRSNHERYQRGQAERVLEMLVEKKLLVRYAGDYTFPTDEYLPSDDEIRELALKSVRKIFNLPQENEHEGPRELQLRPTQTTKPDHLQRTL